MGTTSMEGNLATSMKTFKNLHTHRASISTSRNFSHRKIHVSTQRCPRKDVHSGIVCRSKNVGGKEFMGKEMSGTLWHSHRAEHHAAMEENEYPIDR